MALILGGPEVRRDEAWGVHFEAYVLKDGEEFEVQVGVEADDRGWISWIGRVVGVSDSTDRSLVTSAVFLRARGEA